ncbi:hypothetical protein [Streptomyces sp. NPDC055287]
MPGRRAAAVVGVPAEAILLESKARNTAQEITVTSFLTPTAGIWATGRRISVVCALMTLGPAALADQLRAVAATQTAA